MLLCRRRALPGCRPGSDRGPVFLLVLCLASLLPACARPGLYQEAPGPFAVRVVDAVAVTDPAQSRDLVIRVAAPDAPGPFPVVVFSHGARCYPEAYAPITDHWVSHGYVVLLPNHLDSPHSPALPADQRDRLLDSRIRDVAFLLDEADGILARAGLAGRGDGARMAVAGHSFGALIALVAAGLPLRMPDGKPVRLPHERPLAAVIMSGVGPMPELGVEAPAFQVLTLPLMATGGTLDVGDTGGPVVRPWEWRMAPYTLAPSGDKYSVVLEEGDHYLGGLICRSDRGGPPDPGGVRIDGALTLAFLDAYLKDDPVARAFLAEADIRALTRGRVRFQRK